MKTILIPFPSSTSEEFVKSKVLWGLVGWSLWPRVAKNSLERHRSGRAERAQTGFGVKTIEV